TTPPHNTRQVNNTLDTKAALNGAVEQDFAANHLSVSSNLQVSGNLEVNSGFHTTGEVRVDGNLTVSNGISTNELSVRDTVTTPLTIDNTLTVNRAIDTNELSVTGSVTGSLTIDHDLTINRHVGIGTTNPTQALDMGGRKKNIKFDYAHIGETGSGAATIIANKARVSETEDNRVDYSHTSSDGVTAIELLYTKGISFFTKPTDSDNSTREGEKFFSLEDKDRTYERMRISSTGKVGIGTKNPLHLLHLDGGAYCDGQKWQDASSLEYKQDIKHLTLNQALDTLTELNPVTFQYKGEKNEQHVGFIAEEVPELVASSDRKGLSSMDIVGILTKVVQHQQTEIEKLKLLAKLSLEEKLDEKEK
ncbi:MAG: tail fiber domain-containing protein, partial [Moorea sp. SIO4A3]|nr:tail fiber domain-containing protein [Moorena sp. SIO4A3]